MSTLPQVSINSDYSWCFGCGQNNPIGLKLSFRRDGNTVQAEFTPGRLYQGWPEIVHGGIIASILDEAMSYAVHFEGMTFVTARMEVKFKRPAPIAEPLVITSSITRKTRRLVETKATISLRDGTVVAEGTATQFIVNNGPHEKGNEEGDRGNA